MILPRAPHSARPRGSSGGQPGGGGVRGAAGRLRSGEERAEGPNQAGAALRPPRCWPAAPSSSLPAGSGRPPAGPPPPLRAEQVSHGSRGRARRGSGSKDPLPWTLKRRVLERPAGGTKVALEGSLGRGRSRALSGAPVSVGCPQTASRSSSCEHCARPSRVRFASPTAPADIFLCPGNRCTLHHYLTGSWNKA